MKIEQVVINADGASRGNPGQAAIGATIKDRQGRLIKSISRRIGTATNNQAEYQAVIAALEDVDFGLDYNEQQGGGGLVGETVRILNGNTIEFRSDLNFPSPNQLMEWVCRVLDTHKLQSIPRFSPYFCAKFAGFYSITQIGAISNR